MSSTNSKVKWILKPFDDQQTKDRFSVSGNMFVCVHVINIDTRQKITQLERQELKVVIRIPNKQK